MPGTFVEIGLKELFGFFHMMTTQLFPFQRFLSSTLMGVVLGWVAWQSGSVIPGMLLHGIHNVLLGMMGRSELTEPQELPWSWVLAGTAGAAEGVCHGMRLVWRTAEERSDVDHVFPLQPQGRDGKLRMPDQTARSRILKEPVNLGTCITCVDRNCDDSEQAAGIH